MKIFFVLKFCWCFMLVTGQFDGDPCRTKEGIEGVCKPGRKCPSVIALFKEGLPFTTCSFAGGDHIVCCPPEGNIQNTKRISAAMCDEYKKAVKKKNIFYGGSDENYSIDNTDCELFVGLIVGGAKTKNGEFPHMAALGAVNFDGEIEFYCGGSLISDEFILTAAHCKDSRYANPFARLGDQNIRNRADGLKQLDVPITKIIRHERYSKATRQHDIALARLSRQIAFTKFIRPACLWQEHQIRNERAIATGWGHTEFVGSSSDELLKVILDIQHLENCQNVFDETSFVITENQICAGVDQGGADTCQGDSGGPLQIVQSDNKCVHHIIGVTSYGSACGFKNSPSVYSRVSQYLDWIESIVWPKTIYTYREDY